MAAPSASSSFSATTVAASAAAAGTGGVAVMDQSPSVAAPLATITTAAGVPTAQQSAALDPALAEIAQETSPIFSSSAPAAAVVAAVSGSKSASMGVTKLPISSAAPGKASSGADGAELATLELATPDLPVVRTLSGRKLNAGAPEFVPKTIVPAPTAPSSIPVPLSGNNKSHSSQIPGVLPVQFVEPLLSSSQADSTPSIISTAAPSLAPAPAPDANEGLAARASSPQQTQTSVTPPVHTPHPKPVLTEELKEKIVKQVEFYFSDQNLPTDNYLMKFVKKDPEGFVPMQVVSSFRKVKTLAKHYAVVATALRNSSELVVSADGKKVRRAQPLPDIDLEEVQGRTVVAENLPDNPSIESVEQLFSSVGLVKMVRICQPEAANGTSQTAAKFKADMVVSNKVHALVEFETVEQAEKAVAELTDQRNWRSGLRVRLLLRRIFQNKYGFQKGRKSGGEESGEDETYDEDYERSEEGPGNEGSFDGGGRRGRGRGRGRGTSGRGRGGSQYVGSNGSRSYQSGTSPQGSGNLTSSDVIGKPPPGPRMPDGTRGFTVGRGKVPIVGSA